MMDQTEIDELKNVLKEVLLPKRNEVIRIIELAQEALQQETNVVHVTGNFSVVGDLHGQYYDFLYMLEISKKSYGIVFLGDYVDRGYNSVELMLHILLLKIENQNKVVVLRGNHENRAQTSAYGFMDECLAKYDNFVYWKFCDIFSYMPLAAVINQKYVCLHGGIVPELTLERLNSIDRMVEYPELGSVLWSDPSEDISNFSASQRGAGYLFGSTALQQFLQTTRCSVLVRSHQLIMDGAKEHFDGACITVWSAPNNCYKCKNIASFMEIDSNGHKLVFYEAVEEQYKV